ncbi:D-tagaturonate epimerase UxaE [Alkalibacterium iburiense]|uniref:Tagaturonate/fructuronate epimerase n=1 Tax=Alkalibacterium iburiense TaxID=290589 RepID=A0ABN0X6K1_9LACT
MTIESTRVKEFLNNNKEFQVYEKSVRRLDNSEWMIAKKGLDKVLIVKGDSELLNRLEGELVEDEIKIAPTNHENRLVLNDLFPFTKPRAFGNKVTTMGVGDRLGLASPGHIEVMRNRQVKPILAQQSIRELNLTSRTIYDVLDSAAYAAFQEGYTEGFGADGDHLKEKEDIKLALDAGMTMLTLDCSDHINNDVESYSSDELEEKYKAIPEDERQTFEDRYLNKTFDLNGLTITFSKEELMYNVLLYIDALKYMVLINEEFILPATQEIDFEISIDETETVTQPRSHFFVANELINQNVTVNSLAPRFIGEFQKGVDYMGDIEAFEKDLEKHALIAKHFDYKLSIHSGSDKFSAFPIIAKYTDGLFHLKTAGTNWLEAIRVLAKYNPSLFERMHKYAFENFHVAQAYYHITPDLDSIKPIEEMSAEEYPEYMNDRNARQVWHVTYGVLLTAKNEDGSSQFKEEFFESLIDLEDEYRESLVNHIGKHLDLLNIEER